VQVASLGMSLNHFVTRIVGFFISITDSAEELRVWIGLPHSESSFPTLLIRVLIGYERIKAAS